MEKLRARAVPASAACRRSNRCPNRLADAASSVPRTRSPDHAHRAQAAPRPAPNGFGEPAADKVSTPNRRCDRAQGKKASPKEPALYRLNAIHWGDDEK